MFLNRLLFLMKMAKQTDLPKIKVAEKSRVVEKLHPQMKQMSEMNDSEITMNETGENVGEQEEEKNESKYLLIMIGVIIGVLLLIFGGVALYSKYSASHVQSIDDLHQKNLEKPLGDGKGYVYNGFSFVNVDNLWWTELNKFGTRLKIPLHFGPREVEDIAVMGSLNNELFNRGDKVYIAIDPTVADKYYTLGISELSFNLVKGMDRGAIGSCTQANWACENRTIISCANNTQNLPVIELSLENQTGVFLDGSCIKVSGRGYNITKGVDRVLYQWYGIMK